MRFFRRPGPALILAICLAGAAPASADPLDDAKAKGLVGERIDGYVGAVADDAGVAALIDQINAERRAKYIEIAAKRGAPVEAVAQIAGEKLVGRAGKGTYIMGADGQWRQK